MATNTRRAAIIGTLAVVTAVTAGISYEAGSALAQAKPTPTVGKSPTQRDAHLGALAAKLGIPVEKLQSAMDAVRKDLGLPDRAMRGPMGWRGGPPPLDGAATALGITVQQLRTELPGKSLTDVAKAHNIDPAKVKAALLAQAQARIDTAVKDGKATTDQAAKMKERAIAMVEQAMTHVAPVNGAGRGDGKGPGNGGDGRGGRHGGPPPSGTPGKPTPGPRA